jgi:hypothetical protein
LSIYRYTVLAPRALFEEDEDEQLRHRLTFRELALVLHSKCGILLLGVESVSAHGAAVEPEDKPKVTRASSSASIARTGSRIDQDFLEAFDGAAAGGRDDKSGSGKPRSATA